MIDTQIPLLIAQATSALTTLIGIGALAYLIRVVYHLDESLFKKIFSSLGIFLVATLVGVASMTIYHFLAYSSAGELAEMTELVWYAFIFISLIVSIYGSFITSMFVKTMSHIKTVARKNFRGERRAHKKGKKEH